MRIDIQETYDIGVEMNALLARIDLALVQLTRALDAPPQRNAALIEAQGALISNEVRWFAGRYPGIVATQNAVQARALDQGKTIGATRVQMPQHWYDLNTKVNRLRQDLNLWPEVLDVVRAQIDPPRRPLYPRTPKADDPAAVARAAGDRLDAQMHGLLHPAEQSAAARAHGCHDDIPLPASRFMEHALAARRICLAQGRGAPLRFLDIGCGVGLKVLAALQMFDCADGIEFDPGFAAAAQEMLARADAEGARVGQGDALTFEGYGDYDVLYAFRPMRDDAALADLERRIVEHARPGTLVVAPYRGFAARHRALGCARVAGAVFAVGLSQRAAADLRRSAERIGCALGAPKLAVASLWDGLLAASLANGFARRASDWRDEV